MNTTFLRAGQSFDNADDTRTVITAILGHGERITSLECQVLSNSIPAVLVDYVKYTHAGYIAARERAREECVA